MRLRLKGVQICTGFVSWWECGVARSYEHTSMERVIKAPLFDYVLIESRTLHNDLFAVENWLLNWWRNNCICWRYYWKSGLKRLFSCKWGRDQTCEATQLEDTLTSTIQVRCYLIWPNYATFLLVRWGFLQNSLMSAVFLFVGLFSLFCITSSLLSSVRFVRKGCSQNNTAWRHVNGTYI